MNPTNEIRTNDLRKFVNKKFLVTGGSRGIGAGIAGHLAAQGAQIAFTYSSSEDSAKKVLQALPISASGAPHLMLRMDLADSASIQSVIPQVLSHFGGEIDGLVNNAGITKDQLALRMKEEDFDSVIQVNLRGTFLVTKGLLKPMLRAQKGSIVSITSVIGQTGNSGQANYAASKAGIEGMTKSMALEVASRKIRLNCVAPGFIESDMTESMTEAQKQVIFAKIPLGFIGSSLDVAHAVSFLLSEESNYITGQSINVNGGLFMQ